MNEAEIKRQQEIDDLREILATPAGRRFMWRVLGIAQTFAQSYTGEAQSTAFNEGRRSVGNRLFAEINDHAPASLIEMMRERQAAQQITVSQKLGTSAVVDDADNL